MNAEQPVDDMVSGQYYAASNPNPATATFKLVWIETKTGKSVLGALRANERGSPWTGSVPADDEYVIARNLKFRRNGSLTAASARQLAGYETATLVYPGSAGGMTRQGPL